MLYNKKGVEFIVSDYLASQSDITSVNMIDYDDENIEEINGRWGIPLRLHW